MRSKINGQRCRPHFGERARKKEILMWKVFTCSSKHLFYEISSLRLNKKHIEGTFHTILQNIWCFIALIDTLSAFLFKKKTNKFLCWLGFHYWNLFVRSSLRVLILLPGQCIWIIAADPSWWEQTETWYFSLLKCHSLKF